MKEIHQIRGELALMSGHSASNLEIASSPSEEVKFSLNCNLAFLRPDFDNPSLETDWWRKNVSDHTRLWTRAFQ